jgi:hypothetical protein
MVFQSRLQNVLYTFTPSERSNPSRGWKQLKTRGDFEWGIDLPCMVSAYGGSKIAFYTPHDVLNAVFILDVATLSWTKSSPVLGTYGSACGVSGDQLIIWGGTMANGNATDMTLVYDMKAGTWSTTYTAPLLSTPTSASTSNNGRDVKLIIIIVVATVALLVMIMIAAFVFHRQTRRFNPTSPDDSTSNSSDVKSTMDTRVKPLSKGTSRPRDPTYKCPNVADVEPPTDLKWHKPRLSYQAYRDSGRDHSLSNHPHTMAAKDYNAQGAYSVPQQPHAPINRGMAMEWGDKAEIK